MTKAEIRAIEGIIARLKSPRFGSGEGYLPELNGSQRLYVETWLVGPLELLLPGEGRDPELAASMAEA